jgi:hypothetical protein
VLDKVRRSKINAVKRAKAAVASEFDPEVNPKSKTLISKIQTLTSIPIP